MHTRPRTPRAVAGLLFPLLAASCVSISTQVSSSSEPTVLRRVERDGLTTTWRLHSSQPGEPQVERTEKRPREVAEFGVRVRSLSRERAAELELAAFQGVVVESVRRRSPADAAGLRPGDVLLAIDGAALSSDEQFSDLVQNELAPGTSVSLEVRRGTAGPPEDVQLDLVTGTKSIEDTVTESVALRGSRIVRELTGLEAAELPAELAVDALGLDAAASEGPALVVAGVAVGSPAYLAGLRSGDRVLALDGRPVGGIEPLVAAVLARADARGIARATPERTQGLPARGGDGPLVLDVRGPLGDHRATFDVRGDLDERSEVDIPILFDCEGDLASQRWSLLDFIFQFGANYRSRYVSSATREPARHSFFSMLPFGFYEVSKRPDRSRYTIFWFIDWERRR